MAKIQDKRRTDGDLSPNCVSDDHNRCLCDAGYHDNSPIDGSPARMIGLATALADFAADSGDDELNDLAQSIIYRLCVKRDTDDPVMVGGTVSNYSDGLRKLANALDDKFANVRQGGDLDDPYMHGPGTF